MARRPDVTSDYYRIYTPQEVPLAFCADGYYRLAADVECVKCKKGYVQIIRCDRFRSEMGIEMPNAPRPNPSDERVMTSFMLAACKNGVGEPGHHTKDCPYGNPKLKGRFRLAGITSTMGFIAPPKTGKPS